MMLGTIRSDWHLELTAACQRLAGSTLDGDRDTFTTGVERFRDEIPAAGSAIERLVLHQCLIATLTKAGLEWHDAFHRHCVAVPCPRSPTAITPATWKDSYSEPHAFLSRWLCEYMDTFERDHIEPVELRVARYLRRHFREPLHLASLAHAFGRGRAALVRDFSRAFELTPAEYQTRVRLRQAVSDLRSSDSNVEAVARLVGYRSPKNFYSALKAITGLTPSEVRHLSQLEMRRLFDDELGPSACGPSVTAP